MPAQADNSYSPCQKTGEKRCITVKGEKRKAEDKNKTLKLRQTLLPGSFLKKPQKNSLLKIKRNT
jgi:hypothetical protein